MKIIISIVLALFIAGCSSGPSEAELKEVLTKQTKASLQPLWDGIKGMKGIMSDEQFEKMGVISPDKFEITDLSIENSSKNDNGDHVVKATYTSNAGKKKVTESKRFTLTEQNNTWRILRAE